LKQIEKQSSTCNFIVKFLNASKFFRERERGRGGERERVGGCARARAYVFYVVIAGESSLKSFYLNYFLKNQINFSSRILINFLYFQILK